MRIIHIITEPGSINDGKLNREILFFNQGTGNINVDGALDLFSVTFCLVLVVLESGCEEGVDEGGFTESRFAYRKSSQHIKLYRDILGISTLLSPSLSSLPFPFFFTHNHERVFSAISRRNLVALVGQV